MGLLGGALLVIGALTTGASVDEQKRSNRTARRTTQLQQRQAAVRNQRARRIAAADAAARVGSIRASAASSGITSSAGSGVESSIGSQLASNQGFSRQLEGLDLARFREQENLLKANSRVAQFGAISSLAFSGAGNF